MSDPLDTSNPNATCPECDGSRIWPHVAGLVFVHSQECSILASEDARQVADVDMLTEWRLREFERPSTPAERTLLTAIGYVVPDDLVTVVLAYRGSTAVRFRYFEGFPLQRREPEPEESTA